MEKKRPWKSSILFIMACVGSAVGLGNIWKFPYITFENGGGSFVIVYLLSILIVGLPVLLAEMLIGRHTGLNIYQSLIKITKGDQKWKILGALCLFSTIAIFSFYSVVAGWTLGYLWFSITGALTELTFQNSSQFFGSYVTNPVQQITGQTIIMLLTSIFILKGTKSIERVVEVLMPVFGLLLIYFAYSSLSRYGSEKTLTFLFSADFSKLSFSGVLEALGHAFFTLSIGLGAMTVYGSYFPRDKSLTKAAIWIAILDTLIAIVACLMIFPILFGSQMTVSESAAILFTSMSVELHQFAGGQWASALFYLLIAFAALSSTISMLEPIVAFAIENFKIERKKSILYCTVLSWLIGVTCALSNGANEFLSKFAGHGMMGILDKLTSNWTLPLGGLLIALFAGHVMKREQTAKEMDLDANHLGHRLWVILVKYISPSIITAIFLFKLFA